MTDTNLTDLFLPENVHPLPGQRPEGGGMRMINAAVTCGLPPNES
ncbi:MAG: hypothetical protein ABGZ23_27040 [Fuerstiella sp.]